MADVKDKVITAESLKALHDYNELTYETKDNVNNIETSLNDRITDVTNELTNRITPIENGGTNASDGATGLANLFAAGYTILSEKQYGDNLPDDNSPETKGRIFFKRLTDV